MIEVIIESKTCGNQRAIFDDESYKLYKSRSWFLQKSRNTYYLICNLKRGEKGTKIFHRKFLGLTGPKDLVDHINGNGLDNRSINLRVCTQAENSRNACKRKDATTSKFIGVTEIKTSRNGKPYMVRVKCDGVSNYIGCYSTEIEAAIAYNEAAKNLHKEFARLNEIPEDKECK